MVPHGRKRNSARFGTTGDEWRRVKAQLEAGLR
jgi:hypothetical protein